MEWLTLLIKFITLVFIFAAGGGPALVAYLKSRRKTSAMEGELAEARHDVAKAKNDTAKEKAHADLMEKAKKFITAEEGSLEGFDKIMKAQGSTGGPMKKDLAFIKLQAYALQSCYDFDVDYWSKVIDDLVKFTNTVNVKK